MLRHTEARLQTVPRWTVVDTIQKQSVAEHSYRVSIIAFRMARDFFKAESAEILLQVTLYGLLHDANEGITGDIPGYINKETIEENLRVVYGDKMVNPDPNMFVKNMVKIADLTESLIFLNREYSMGNQSIARILASIEKKLDNHIDSHVVANARDQLKEYLRTTIQSALGLEMCMQDPMDPEGEGK